MGVGTGSFAGIEGMNWNSASEFFAMGGYGLYVWGSYIATALLMVIEPILARGRHARARAAAAILSEES
jgi:heme exporter protein D